MHKLESFKCKLLAVWFSGNGVGRVNEVTLRPAQLEMKRVIVLG